MEKVKISIIVPVYNAEKFLKKTIESVLKQSANLELILVDDGSTDESGKICDSYQEKDTRVKVIHQKNGGLCVARNSGIRSVSGTHVAFLDADDFLDEDTLVSVQAILEKNDPDILDFGWKYIGNQGEITENLHKLLKNQMLDEHVIREKILPPLLNLKKDEDHFVYDFCWNKIYKTSILEEQHICFDETRRVWEDRPFVVQYLKYCKTYYAMDRCFYNYVSVTDSLSRTYHMEFFDVILKNYQLYRKWFGDVYEFETTYVWNHWSHSIENMIYRSLQEKKNQEKIEQNMIKALQNPQIKQWFEHRQPEDDFEKQTSALIVAGNENQALQMYKNKFEKDKKKSGRGGFRAFIRKIMK